MYLQKFHAALAGIFFNLFNNYLCKLKSPLEGALRPTGLKIALKIVLGDINIRKSGDLEIKTITD